MDPVVIHLMHIEGILAGSMVIIIGFLLIIICILAYWCDSWEKAHRQ